MRYFLVNYRACVRAIAICVAVSFFCQNVVLAAGTDIPMPGNLLPSSGFNFITGTSVPGEFEVTAFLKYLQHRIGVLRKKYPKRFLTPELIRDLLSEQFTQGIPGFDPQKMYPQGNELVMPLWDREIRISLPDGRTRIDGESELTVSEASPAKDEHVMRSGPGSGPDHFRGEPKDRGPRERIRMYTHFTDDQLIEEIVKTRDEFLARKDEEGYSRETGKTPNFNLAALKKTNLRLYDYLLNHDKKNLLHQIPFLPGKEDLETDIGGGMEDLPATSSGAEWSASFVEEIFDGGFLTATEKTILTLFFGLGGQWSAKAPVIARELNLTRQRIDQLREKAIDKIRRWIATRDLAIFGFSPGEAAWILSFYPTMDGFAQRISRVRRMLRVSDDAASSFTPEERKNLARSVLEEPWPPEARSSERTRRPNGRGRSASARITPLVAITGIAIGAAIFLPAISAAARGLYHYLASSGISGFLPGGGEVTLILGLPLLGSVFSARGPGNEARKIEEALSAVRDMTAGRDEYDPAEGRNPKERKILEVYGELQREKGTGYVPDLTELAERAEIGTSTLKSRLFRMNLDRNDRYLKALVYRGSDLPQVGGKRGYASLGWMGEDLGFVYSPFLHAPVLEELFKVGIPLAIFNILSFITPELPALNLSVFVSTSVILAFVFLAAHLLNEDGPYSVDRPFSLASAQIRAVFLRHPLMAAKKVHKTWHYIKVTRGTHYLAFNILAAPAYSAAFGILLSLPFVVFLGPSVFNIIPLFLSMLLHYFQNRRIKMINEKERRTIRYASLPGWVKMVFPHGKEAIRTIFSKNTTFGTTAHPRSPQRLARWSPFEDGVPMASDSSSPDGIRPLGGPEEEAARAASGKKRSLEELIASGDIAKGTSEYVSPATARQTMEKAGQVLTREEEQTLFRALHSAWRPEDKPVKRAVVDMIVMKNQGLVWSAVRKFVYTEDKNVIADAVQDGNLGLLEAILRFGYEFNHKFSTYASHWIKKYIKEGSKIITESIHIPRKEVERSDRLKKFVVSLQNTLGRVPCVDEIAEKAGLAVSEVVRLLGVRAIQPDSLYVPVKKTLGSGKKTVHLGDLIAGSGGVHYQEDISSKEVLSYLFASLTFTQRVVVKMRNGIGTVRDKRYSVREIGSLIGCSGANVHLIEKEALRVLGRAVSRKKDSEVTTEGVDNTDVHIAEILQISPLKQGDLFEKEFRRIREERLKDERASDGTDDSGLTLEEETQALSSVSHDPKRPVSVRGTIARVFGKDVKPGVVDIGSLHGSFVKDFLDMHGDVVGEMIGIDTVYDRSRITADIADAMHEEGIWSEYERAYYAGEESPLMSVDEVMGDPSRKGTFGVATINKPPGGMDDFKAMVDEAVYLGARLIFLDANARDIQEEGLEYLRSLGYDIVEMPGKPEDYPATEQMRVVVRERFFVCERKVEPEEINPEEVRVEGLPVVWSGGKDGSGRGVAGVQIDVGSISGNTVRMAGIVEALASLGRKAPGLVIFPEQIDEDYMSWTDEIAGKRREILRQKAIATGIAIGYGIEHLPGGDYERGSVFYEIVKPVGLGSELTRFRKYDYVKENRLVEINGTKIAVLICGEAEALLAPRSRGIRTDSDISRADLLIVPSTTDMWSAKFWPGALFEKYGVPAAFINRADITNAGNPWHDGFTPSRYREPPDEATILSAGEQIMILAPGCVSDNVTGDKEAMASDRSEREAIERVSCALRSVQHSGLSAFDIDGMAHRAVSAMAEVILSTEKDFPVMSGRMKDLADGLVERSKAFRVERTSFDSASEDGALTAEAAEGYARAIAEYGQAVRDIRTEAEKLVSDPVERTYPGIEGIMGLYREVWKEMDRLSEAVKSRSELASGTGSTDLIPVSEVIRLVVSGRPYVTMENELAPDVLLEGNRLSFAGAVANIVDNAVFFAAKRRTNDGTPAFVTITLAEEKGNIRIDITDTGGGISHDLLVADYVMQRPRFFNLDVSRREGGTGLGATEAWYAVKDMEGSINVSSAPGEGTTFTIGVPIATSIPTEVKAKFHKPGGPGLPQLAKLPPEAEATFRNSGDTIPDSTKEISNVFPELPTPDAARGSDEVKRSRSTIEDLKPERTVRILDIGSGTGAESRWGSGASHREIKEVVRRRTAKDDEEVRVELIGIDKDAEEVRRGKALGFDIREMDARKSTGFKEKSFDLITRYNPSTTKDILDILPEVKRVLKPEGEFWVAPWLEDYDEFLNVWRRDPKYLQHYVDALEANGFSAEVIEEHRPDMPPVLIVARLIPHVPLEVRAKARREGGLRLAKIPPEGDQAFEQEQAKAVMTEGAKPLLRDIKTQNRGEIYPQCTAYSHITAEKFRQMVECLAGGKIGDEEEKELVRFDKVLEELELVRQRLNGGHYNRLYHSVSCFEASKETIDVLSRNGFSSVQLIRRKFIDDKIPSKIFGPASAFLYGSWIDDDGDTYAHSYVVARIAGEYFVIDLSAGQFLTEQLWDYKDLGIFIVPIKDLDEHSWPYAMGDVFLNDKEEALELVSGDEKALEAIMNPRGTVPEGVMSYAAEYSNERNNTPGTRVPDDTDTEGMADHAAQDDPVTETLSLPPASREQPEMELIKELILTSEIIASASLTGEPVIVGIDTSWVPAEQRALDSFGAMLRQLKGLPAKLGAHHITILTASDPEVLSGEIDRVIKKRDKTVKMSNILLIGQFDGIDGSKNTSYDRFKTSPEGESACFAHIVVPAVSAGKHYDVDMQSILRLALAEHRAIHRQGGKRFFYLNLPGAGQDGLTVKELHDRHRARNYALKMA